jgi:hypothetical protein
MREYMYSRLRVKRASESGTRVGGSALGLPEKDERKRGGLLTTLQCRRECHSVNDGQESFRRLRSQSLRETRWD